MSAVRGIAKNLSALFSGHAINFLQNLVQVPFFIHSYGRSGYGEWLVLSASVSCLGMLDFGVQTYINQDLTVCYSRGNMDRFHIQQSTALRLLLGIVSAAAIICLVIFFLPLQKWLRVDGSNVQSPILQANIVHWSIYLLALQALINIPTGYFMGTFMVFGKAYIGGYWSSMKNLLFLFSTIAMVWVHASFSVIALGQLISIVVTLFAVMLHLYNIAPDIFPTLRLWDINSVPRILKQSGYFALLWSGNFLVYQVPLIILQRSVGPATVTLFSIMRTIFSMTRNQMNTFTQSMGPEITTLYGRKDWPMLTRLYTYSERLIFSAIPIVNLGVLYLSPFLLTIWFHGTGSSIMFLPMPYLLASAISIVMSIKEHKYQFQFSTNTHQLLAIFTVCTYLALDLLWTILIPRFGLIGLLWIWLIVEIFQLLYIVRLNVIFFRAHQQIELSYLLREFILVTLCLFLSVRGLPFVFHLPLFQQITVVVGICCLIFLVDLRLFDLYHLLNKSRKLFIQLFLKRSLSEYKEIDLGN